MPTTRTALPLALALAVAGCGSSSGAGGPADARSFCVSLSEELWGQRTRCAIGEPLPRPEAPYALGCGSFQEAQDEGRVLYDRAQAVACLDALRGWSCAAAQILGRPRDGYDAFSVLPAACRKAVAPQVALGGECHSWAGIECADGRCDFPDEDACVSGAATCVPYLPPDAACGAELCQPGYRCDGTCVPDTGWTVLNPGDPCNVPDAFCGDGLFCDASTDPDTCAPRAGAGLSCAATPCLEGLLCRADTCIEPRRVGAACAGGDCAAGLFCDARAICAEYPRQGESCDATGSIDPPYCVDSWCNPSAAGGPACEPVLAPGAPCPVIGGDAWWHECGPGLACEAPGQAPGQGVCRRLYCPNP